MGFWIEVNPIQTYKGLMLQAERFVGKYMHLIYKTFQIPYVHNWLFLGIKGSEVPKGQTITFSKNDILPEQRRKRPKNLIDGNESTDNVNVHVSQNMSYNQINPENNQCEPSSFISEDESAKVEDNSVEIKFQMKQEQDKEVNTESKTEHICSNPGEFEIVSSSETQQEENNARQMSLDEYQFVTKKRKNARITFLDFAGQDIYYAFHQIYLSPKAAYILVLDMTKKFDATEPTDTQKDLTRFKNWTYKGNLTKIDK